MKLLGILLILLGLALIVYSVWFLHAPMEEPASPGKTPNPSKMDEIVLLERLIFIHQYVVPGLGLLMAIFGGWMLMPDPRPRARESP